MYNLIQGDCLKEMDKLIAKGIRVDMILTDPPYGTTACKWDTIIPFEPLWEKINNIIKPNGCVVLFGSEPFSSALRMSNSKYYKYDWIWKKERPSNPQLAKVTPLKSYENILVFYKRSGRYTPQGIVEIPIEKRKIHKPEKNTLGHCQRKQYVQTHTNYPDSILFFKSERGLHPTQKPVTLLEYLIKTYTDEGETVLDFTMGSGSTGVACLNTKRNFIGIELDDRYYNVAKNRLKESEK